jgi:molybdenum cofactor guanylyltransferase
MAEAAMKGVRVERIAGVVLAGGLSRRMGGGDKALRVLGGKPLIAHVLDRLARQAAPVAINANGDPSRFAAFGVPVISDENADFAGPLAGILAGMAWARRVAPEARLIATAACDTPFFPDTLVERLAAAVAHAPAPTICLAASNGRTHPIFGLWPVALMDDLAASLGGGMRKVGLWAEGHPHLVVDFEALPHDPFFNANTPEDLALAQQLTTNS